MNAALDFYRRCRAIAPRRSDMVLDDVKRAAMASLRLTDSERREVLTDLARLMKGEVPCPKCHHEGPHTSNAHHRVGSIKFTCAACGAKFTTKEVQS